MGAAYLHLWLLHISSLTVEVLTFLEGFTFRPLLSDLIFSLIFSNKIFYLWTFQPNIFFSYHNSQWPILLGGMNFWKADRNPRSALVALRERQNLVISQCPANGLSMLIEYMEKGKILSGWGENDSERTGLFPSFLMTNTKRHTSNTWSLESICTGFLIGQGFTSDAQRLK